MVFHHVNVLLMAFEILFKIRPAYGVKQNTILLFSNITATFSKILIITISYSLELVMPIKVCLVTHEYT